MPGERAAMRRDMSRPALRRLSSAGLPSCQIGILARAIDPVVADALDQTPRDRLPHLRATGGLDFIRQRLADSFAAASFGPDWLVRWLSDDVVFLARLFQDLVGAKRFLLRLEVVEDDACRRFHTDNVRFRLITTYRGSGTEWVSPDAAATMARGAEVSDGSINRLERGEVAIMRGAREATPECPGILHRSPPIAGSAVTRLFLAIDDAADHAR